MRAPMAKWMRGSPKRSTTGPLPSGSSETTRRHERSTRDRFRFTWPLSVLSTQQCSSPALVSHRCCSSWADYASARIQYEIVLEGIERTFGADQPFYADALSSLGSLLQASGELDQALEVQRRTLRIRSAAHGPSHPDVAATLSQIAALHYQDGDAARARELYGQALEIQEEALGKSHPEVANTLTGLARTYQSPAEWSEGEQLYSRSIAIYEEALGADHPSLINPLVGWGELLSLEGRPDRARALFARSMAIADQVAGEDFPQIAKILNADARALARLERWREAFEVALRGASTARSHVRSTARALPESEALTYAGYMKDNLDLLLTIAVWHPESGEDVAARAWDSLIRSRALVFDEMAARHRAVTKSSDPEIRRLFEELIAARQKLANLIVRGPEALPLDSYHEILARARKQRDIAELGLADRNQKVGAPEDQDRGGLEEVWQSLPGDSGLVAFVLFRSLA